MTVIDQLLENNSRYADGFDKGELPLPPARNLAVVACMDARLDVHKILGLDEGDAHVIRNAGGVVSDDAIRSLVISQRLLGTTGNRADSPYGLRHADLPGTTPSRTPSRPIPGCVRPFQWRPSETSKKTSANPSPVSRPVPSFLTRTRCAASFTTAPPAV